jgi:hypothetical protein
MMVCACNKQNRAAEQALAESNALAKHLESSLLKDLNKLDADALKLRIIQLTGEMQERTKWEVSRTALEHGMPRALIGQG